MGPCAEAFTFANPFSRPKSGNARMNLIETERLAIRKMEDADDAFILGLLKRDQVEHPDIGFALSEEYWGMGYAIEAARAVMDYGLTSLGHSHIVAISSPANAASIRLLEKLGLRNERKFRMKEDDPEAYFFS